MDAELNEHDTRHMKHKTQGRASQTVRLPQGALLSLASLTWLRRSGIRAPGLRTPACASGPSGLFGLCLTPRSARLAMECASRRSTSTDWRSPTSRGWAEITADVCGCGAGELDRDAAGLEGEGSSCHRTRRLVGALLGRGARLRTAAAGSTGTGGSGRGSDLVLISRSSRSETLEVPASEGVAPVRCISTGCAASTGAAATGPRAASGGGGAPASPPS